MVILPLIMYIMTIICTHCIRYSTGNYNQMKSLDHTLKIVYNEPCPMIVYMYISSTDS